MDRITNTAQAARQRSSGAGGHLHTFLDAWRRPQPVAGYHGLSPELELHRGRSFPQPTPNTRYDSLKNELICGPRRL